MRFKQISMLRGSGPSMEARYLVEGKLTDYLVACLLRYIKQSTRLSKVEEPGERKKRASWRGVFWSRNNTLFIDKPTSQAIP